MSQPVTPRNRSNASADLQQSQENIVTPTVKLGVPNLSLEEIQKRMSTEDTSKEEKHHSTSTESSFDAKVNKRGSDHYVEVLFARQKKHSGEPEKGPVTLSRSKSFNLEDTKVSMGDSPSKKEKKKNRDLFSLIERSSKKEKKKTIDPFSSPDPSPKKEKEKPIDPFSLTELSPKKEKEKTIDPFSLAELSPKKEKEKNIPVFFLEKFEKDKKKSFFLSPRKYSGESKEAPPQFPRWKSYNFQHNKLPPLSSSLKKSESQMDFKNPLPYLNLIPKSAHFHFSIKTAEKELIIYLSKVEKELIKPLSEAEKELLESLYKVEKELIKPFFKIEHLSQTEKEHLERVSKAEKELIKYLSQAEKEHLERVSKAEKELMAYFSKIEPLSEAEKELIQSLSKNIKINDEIIAIFDEIVAIFLKGREQLSTVKHRQRFRRFLIRILMWREPKGAKILFLYFCKRREDLTPFAIEALDKLKKLKSGEILSLLYKLTKIDLEFGVKATLFREAGPSSVLCKVWGEYLGHSELNIIAAHIVRELRKWKPFDLCIERDQVQTIMEESKEEIIQVQFKADKEKLIQAQIIANRHNFQIFAEAILNVIYAIEFNRDFLELLQMRRAAIIEFLQENGEPKPKNASRPYLGELLFLRILIPRILNIESAQPTYSVLVSLTKVIQCLASEKKFGDEKRDLIYEPLNESIIVKFSDKHKKVVDGLSLIGEVEKEDPSLKVQEQP